MRQITIVLTEGFADWEATLIAARLMSESQAIPVELTSPFAMRNSGVHAATGPARIATDHAQHMGPEHRAEWAL